MKEHGICAKCKKSVGCPYADDRITGCKNFVLEPELKLTNEESLRQYNTEQLADVITDIVWECKEQDDCMDCKLGWCSKDYVVKWLKQPHTAK